MARKTSKTSDWKAALKASIEIEERNLERIEDEISSAYTTAANSQTGVATPALELRITRLEQSKSQTIKKLNSLRFQLSLYSEKRNKPHKEQSPEINEWDIVDAVNREKELEALRNSRLQSKNQDLDREH